MAKVSLRQGCVSGLALSAAAALWLGFASAPALAGDDGAAPIWESFGSLFSLGGDKDKDEKVIEYRDQPRLVLPPRMELPPPAAPPTASATDWPRDPDIEAIKRAKAEKNKIRTMNGDPMHNLIDRGKVEDGVVTTKYTAGMGPSDRRCAAGPGQTCNDDGAPKAAINWNPLSWVGIQKKAATVLGPEPDRTSLTDPPLGYRAPVEGPGVKIDTN
jgi:hypothetical protein